MREEDIRTLLRAQPFRPIRLVLTNNLVHEIHHRDFVGLTRTILELGSPTSEDAQPGSVPIIGIALIHIVQYELLPASPSGSST